METTRWQDIDTSTSEGLRLLDRMIATRLGWRVIAHSLNEVNPTKGELYLLVAPHERAYSADDYLLLIKMAGNYAKRLTPQAAWLDAPEYTSDANAALALVSKMPGAWMCGLDQQLVNRLYVAEIYHGLDRELDRFVQRASTPALAICKAWLMYMDAQPITTNAER